MSLNIFIYFISLVANFYNRRYHSIFVRTKYIYIKYSNLSPLYRILNVFTPVAIYPPAAQGALFLPLCFLSNNKKRMKSAPATARPWTHFFLIKLCGAIKIRFIAELWRGEEGRWMGKGIAAYPLDRIPPSSSYNYPEYFWPFIWAIKALPTSTYVWTF